MQLLWLTISRKMIISYTEQVNDALRDLHQRAGIAAVGYYWLLCEVCTKEKRFRFNKEEIMQIAAANNIERYALRVMHDNSLITLSLDGMIELPFVQLCWLNSGKEPAAKRRQQYLLAKQAESDILASREQRKKKFIENVWHHWGNGNPNMREDFIEYWTECGDTHKKMRFEKQVTFEIPKRIARWQRNAYTAKPDGARLASAEAKEYE
jgi:hypothetical protein